MQKSLLFGQQNNNYRAESTGIAGFAGVGAGMAVNYTYVSNDGRNRSTSIVTENDNMWDGTKSKQ